MGAGLIFRLIQLCVCLYVLAAVIFTTCVYVLTPVSRFLRSRTNPHPALSLYSHIRDSAPVQRFPMSFQGPQEMPRDLSELVDPLDDHHESNNWPVGYTSSGFLYLPRTGDPSGRILSTNGLGVREETFLSKAFSEAIHPTRIIPFYFKASSHVNPDDVAIATLVTSNRLKVFKQLVERYRGPISVTIHIPLPLHATFSSLKPDHPSRVALNNLHALYASSSLFARHVDVHLALSPFTSALSAGPVSQTESDSEGSRQFNVWRNVARLFARTDFVMMLDVDFAVCTDWREFVRDAIRTAASSSPIGSPFRTGRRPRRTRDAVHISANTTEIVKKLREGAAALVVPAFEYVKQQDGTDQRTFPTDKEVGAFFSYSTPET